MKQVIDYLVGEFTDYKGLVHKVVIASISEELPFYHSHPTHEEEDYSVYHYTESKGQEDYATVRKALKLGVSVCNPGDSFNEEKGKKAAIARAKNSSPVLYSTKTGIINTPMVKALMQQELDFIYSNPEIIIPGYNDSKARYEYNQKMNAEIAGLSEDEKKCLEILTSSNTNQVDKLTKLATFVNNRK